MTGGAGYIGSHTVRALRVAGRDVVVLDSLELGRADAVLDAPLVPRRNPGCCAGATGVSRLRSHAIVHCAAYKSDGESMQTPGKYWHNNVAGTAALIESEMQSDVTDVVFSSSCSVYGTPSHVPVSESASYRPRERVRREQGDGGTEPPVVRHDQRPAIREPALLQRRRCQP